MGKGTSNNKESKKQPAMTPKEKKAAKTAKKKGVAILPMLPAQG